MAESTKVYKITSVRRNPGFYESKREVQYGSEKKARALWDARVRTSWGQSKFESVKVEVGEVVQWTDVSKEFPK